MIRSKKPTSLTIDAHITKNGIDILVNRELFPITYERSLWKSLPAQQKIILRDNIAPAATLFLPLIHKLNTIHYKTQRPIAETSLFKTGIYDMPVCAATDHASSLSYIKRFFNVEPTFTPGDIAVPDSVSFTPTKKIKPVIPFSFGKESLLTFAVCKNLGLDPVLVSINEPSNKYEARHKAKLIPAFEKEFKTKIHTITYSPGWFRYGRHWGYKTELGWGVQLTEYCMLLLPFLHKYKANAILIGNEHSCDDQSWDDSGLRMYEVGYDQHSHWIGQLGMLASTMLGRRVNIMSFVDPLGELAEMIILHTKFPNIGKYQLSCFADTASASGRRWCQNCFKCFYSFALLRAAGIDYRNVGFDQNLFNKKNKTYTGLFSGNPDARSFGNPDELALALYMASKRGDTGAAINSFAKKGLANVQHSLKRITSTVLAVHPSKTTSEHYAKKIADLYKKSLAKFRI